jgi:hypothetical protein
MKFIPSKVRRETTNVHSHLDMLTLRSQHTIPSLLRLMTARMVHTMMRLTSRRVVSTLAGRHTLPLPRTKRTQPQATSATTHPASFLLQPKTSSATSSSRPSIRPECHSPARTTPHTHASPMHKPVRQRPTRRINILYHLLPLSRRSAFHRPAHPLYPSMYPQ